MIGEKFQRENSKLKKYVYLPIYLSIRLSINAYIYIYIYIYIIFKRGITTHTISNELCETSQLKKGIMYFKAFVRMSK